jgi:hypothetical protein
MVRRQVIELKCDRCNRVENQDSYTLPAGVTKELTITLHGKTVEYIDLCKRCRDAIQNYYNSITKQEVPEKKPETTPEVPGAVKAPFMGMGKK